MASKSVSVDEYLNARKSFVDNKGRLHKGLVVDEKRAPASFNKSAGTMRFTMSAEVEDRDFDIVYQAGISLDEFKSNPAAPFAHRSAGFPIGQWKDVEQVLNGRPKRTEGTLVLTAGDPDADRLKLHFEAGSIRACSIGFIPKAVERREAKDGSGWIGFDILEATLLECSPCVLPANPAALAKAAADGDVLSREIIEEVLDNWKVENGLLMPRKAFEDAHKQASGDKHTITLSLDAKQAIADMEGARDALAQDEGFLSRVAKALGLKGKTEEAADPAPEQGGKKPAPEPTPEQKLKADLAKDLPEIEALHDMIEADADLAALDAEMGQHVPA